MFLAGAYPEKLIGGANLALRTETPTGLRGGYEQSHETEAF